MNTQEWLSRFRHQLWLDVQSPEWWADNFLIYVIFGLLVGLLWAIVSGRNELRRERRRRGAFEGWYLRIVAEGDEEHSLYHSDVERFLASQFELWKFVKSVVSGTHFVKAGTAQQAIDAKWLTIDRVAKRIVIDLRQAPPEHISPRQSGPPEMNRAADLSQ